MDLMGSGDPSLVLGRGRKSTDIAVWSANHGGDPITSIDNAHADAIMGVVSTNTQRSFVTYSADLRARIWTELPPESHDE